MGRHAAALALAFAACWLARPAAAQNDWQYPDPYFGILEIEKSHDAAAWRRYRAEVSPPPRRPAGGEEKSAAGSAGQPAPARSPRFRWRTRSRR